jgi:hypothetical protein
MPKFLGPYFIKPILREEIYPDFSMFEELKNIFSKIVPGALVRGALYMWNKDAGLHKSGYRNKWKDIQGNPLLVTDQFLSSTKLCDVQLILDNYSSEHHKNTFKYLQESLGEDNVIVDPRTGENDPEYRLKLCEEQKIAKQGYMHDKFFLISEVNGLGKWVIIQLTANINITQCHQFNNMVIVYDDESLFKKYLMHWKNLKININARKNNEEVINPNIFMNESLNEDDVVSAYFFPRKICPICSELNMILKNNPSSRQHRIKMN